MSVIPLASPPLTEKGLCQCGCGGKTNIAPHSRTNRAWVAGEPVPFIYSHGRGGLREFWARVEKRDDGCWEWTGRKNAKGYGTVSDMGKRRVAHRWYWEQLNGAVPNGHELDHVCRNRSCVNPDHLEVVTHAENMARSMWATATHCQRGHEYTEENTHITYKNGGRQRHCRVCARVRWRERHGRS